MAKRTIYRDRKTGRFVSKSTWRRSRAQAGTRYKRERLKVSRRERPSVLRPAAPPPEIELTEREIEELEETEEEILEELEEEEVSEWITSLSYDKTGRSFDVLVTARDEAEAYKVASAFLRDDPAGRNIVRAGFEGWSITVARGNKTDEAPGEAEYRSKSRTRRKK